MSASNGNANGDGVPSQIRLGRQALHRLLKSEFAEGTGAANLCLALLWSVLASVINSKILDDLFFFFFLKGLPSLGCLYFFVTLSIKEHD